MLGATSSVTASAQATCEIEVKYDGPPKGKVVHPQPGTLITRVTSSITTTGPASYGLRFQELTYVGRTGPRTYEFQIQDEQEYNLSAPTKTSKTLKIYYAGDTSTYSGGGFRFSILQRSGDPGFIVRTMTKLGKRPCPPS